MRRCCRRLRNRPSDSIGRRDRADVLLAGCVFLSIHSPRRRTSARSRPSSDPRPAAVHSAAPVRCSTTSALYTRDMTQHMEMTASPDKPFGEADCESEIRQLGDDYQKYYFYHTRFNRDAL